MVLFRGARRALVARVLLGRLFLLFSGAFALGACGLTTQNAEDGLEDDGGSGSRGASGGKSGTGGAPSSLTGGAENETGGRGDETGGTGGETDGLGGSWDIHVYDSLGRSCEVDLSVAGIQEHAVDRTRARVFFTWTTEEQAEELRGGGPLYSRGEIPGKGRGRAADLLFARAEASPDHISALVAPYFETCRYGWPHPWATRIGLGGEDYGDKLVRIELKPEAWVGMLAADGNIEEVFDLEGERVDDDLVREHPERIGALYFSYSGEENTDYCGTFGSGGAGDYREFVLGNAAMVLRYEMGTEAVRRELDDGATFLSEYLFLAKKCSEPDESKYGRFAACNFDWGDAGDPYLNALALPGPAYFPSEENLEALIDILTHKLIEPDLELIQEDP